MYRAIPNCKKCKGPMVESYLTDKGKENYVRFFVGYCPKCIKLNDEIPAIVMAHEVQEK